MVKLVFSIYDVQADMYDSPMVFDNEKVAFGTIRRNVRDMYLRKEITLDALRDRQMRFVGTFNTQTGDFGESDLDNLNIRMSDFVGDLVVNDDEI